ncbi:uncharacterized protein [Solanum tuberosum]|uniref:uncharacterized protein isoform X2 n=1 Tax=Solanum tuberosum TaxID=4113 RepID=UPI00073A1801|nr:PREDICTED: uncharacterized protein LOC102593649 isoform X2 [Solanum tuberosum]
MWSSHTPWEPPSSASLTTAALFSAPTPVPALECMWQIGLQIRSLSSLTMCMFVALDRYSNLPNEEREKCPVYKQLPKSREPGNN